MFNSFQDCLHKNQKLITKNLQSNNETFGIRDGYVEIDNICKRVRQRLSDMEQREKEIYTNGDSLTSNICNHGDTGQNMGENFGAIDNTKKTLKYKEFEDNRREASSGYVYQTTDENKNYLDGKNPLSEILQRIKNSKKIRERKEDQSIPNAATLAYNLKGSSGQNSTKKKGVNVNDETIRYNLMAEKLRNEQILRDVDESLRAISRVNVVANSLTKYGMRCHLLQDKLKHVAKEVYESLTEKTLVDRATEMSNVSINTVKIKRTKCTKKSVSHEMSSTVDESLKAISEIYNIINTLLNNLNWKCKKIREKLIVKNKNIESKYLRTDHNIDKISDEVAEHACVEILKNPVPHNKKSPSRSIQNPKMEGTTNTLRKKLRQQTDPHGSYFMELADTIDILSSNFNVVNKLVESVNKDIVTFSKTASRIRDGDNFLHKKGRVRSRKSKRMNIRSPKSKGGQRGQLVDQSMGLNKTSKPITPIIYRKQATTDIWKKLKMEVGPRNDVYRKMLTTFGPICNYNSRK